MTGQTVYRLSHLPPKTELVGILGFSIYSESAKPREEHLAPYLSLASTRGWCGGRKSLKVQGPSHSLINRKGGIGPSLTTGQEVASSEVVIVKLGPLLIVSLQ